MSLKEQARDLWPIACGPADKPKSTPSMSISQVKRRYLSPLSLKTAASSPIPQTTEESFFIFPAIRLTKYSSLGKKIVLGDDFSDFRCPPCFVFGPIPAIRFRRNLRGPVPALRFRRNLRGPVPALRFRRNLRGPVPALRFRRNLRGPVPALRFRR